MAELHVCDICGEVLKDDVHVIAFSKYNYQSEVAGIPPKDFEDFLDELAVYNYQSPKKPKVKEICSSCWKILDKFFKIRMNELAKIKKELNALEKNLEKEK